MADDELIGDVVGGSSFDDQVARFMLTPQFAALLSNATASSSAARSPAGSVPVGGIVTFGGEVVPDGWLVCNGNTFERTTYPDLASTLGRRFALAGDAEGIYRVPTLANPVTNVQYVIKAR